MSKRQARQHSDTFKAKVALAALKGDKKIEEICQIYDVYPSLVYKWKKQLLDSAEGVFSDSRKRQSKSHHQDHQISRLHEKIGQLVIERDFLKKVLDSSSG